MVKLAQTPIKIGDEFWLKATPGTGIINTQAYQSLGGFISAVLPNVYVIAGIILFVLFLAGGFMLITSAGKSDQEGTKKGQKAITAAIAGFLIIFLSYWIIQLIGFVTGLEKNPLWPKF